LIFVNLSEFLQFTIIYINTKKCKSAIFGLFGVGHLWGGLVIRWPVAVGWSVICFCGGWLAVIRGRGWNRNRGGRSSVGGVGTGTGAGGHPLACSNVGGLAVGHPLACGGWLVCDLFLWRGGHPLGGWPVPTVGKSARARPPPVLTGAGAYTPPIRPRGAGIACSVAAVSKLFMGLRYLLTRQGCLIFRNLHNYAGNAFLMQIKRKIIKV